MGIDVALVPVVANFLSSSTTVACWVTDENMALRFGMNVLSEGGYLARCVGRVLLGTSKKNVLGSPKAEHVARGFIQIVRVAQTMVS
jgi:hypothetical protein